MLLLLWLPGWTWLRLLLQAIMGVRTLALHCREFVGASVDWSMRALVLLNDGSSNISEREHLRKI